MILPWIFLLSSGASNSAAAPGQFPGAVRGAGMAFGVSDDDFVGLAWFSMVSPEIPWGITKSCSIQVSGWPFWAEDFDLNILLILCDGGLRVSGPSGFSGPSGPSAADVHPWWFNSPNLPRLCDYPMKIFTSSMFYSSTLSHGIPPLLWELWDGIPYKTGNFPVLSQWSTGLFRYSPPAAGEFVAWFHRASAEVWATEPGNLGSAMGKHGKICETMGVWQLIFEMWLIIPYWSILGSMFGHCLDILLWFVLRVDWCSGLGSRNFRSTKLKMCVWCRNNINKAFPDKSLELAAGLPEAVAGAELCELRGRTGGKSGVVRLRGLKTHMEGQERRFFIFLWTWMIDGPMDDDK